MNHQIQELLQTELQQLQQGLTNLKPAVEHIKLAATTTDLVVASARKSTVAVSKLQIAQTAYYEELKRDISQFVETLKTSNDKAIEQALVTFTASFQNNLGQFETTIHGLNQDFQTQANQQLNKIEISANKQLDEVNKTTKAVLNAYEAQTNNQKQLFNDFITKFNEQQQYALAQLFKIVDSTENYLKVHQETTQKHIAQYDLLVKASNNLIRTINDVDFPNRLDKIDNAISVTNMGISQLNLKIEPLERSIKEQQEAHYQALLSNQKNNQTWQVLLNIITLIIMLGLCAFVFYKSR